MYGALWPRLALDIWGGMGYTVASHCPIFFNEGADFEGIMGRLLGAGISRGHLPGVGLSWSRLPEHGCLLAVQPAGHQKAVLHLDALRGAVGPMS